ncbi:MAG: LacI family DNA-binding transcriptional regulator [Thermodesulfobacteriota bacterium]|nr:LacI family DNA-binding transcriptional regulator [Thermodesulfobacteriota bacterium]
MATIRDVARKANVSIATVSRVVNNNPHKVNKATRKRVLEAIRGFDYRPNALAKSLLFKKTMTIGIIIPDISNPYYAEIVRGIQDVADQHGYAVMLQNTDRKQERIVNYIYLLREKAADGVIFSGGIIHRDEIFGVLRELRERVVVIGRHKGDFPAVLVDNVGGAAQAIHHLIDLGHKRIGFIGGPDKSTTAKDRLKGYRNAIDQRGYPFDKILIKQGDLTPQSGYLAARELLMQRNRPTAIFAANDQMAFGTINAAKGAGLSVPDDLAVVGFDNIPLSSYFEPSLTTVEIPMYSIGVAAMGMLVDLISLKNGERARWFGTKLLIRDSTVKKGMKKS